MKAPVLHMLRRDAVQRASCSDLPACCAALLTVFSGAMFMMTACIRTRLIVKYLRAVAVRPQPLPWPPALLPRPPLIPPLQTLHM